MTVALLDLPLAQCTRIPLFSAIALSICPRLVFVLFSPLLLPISSSSFSSLSYRSKQRSPQKCGTGCWEDSSNPQPKSSGASHRIAERGSPHRLRSRCILCYSLVENQKKSITPKRGGWRKGEGRGVGQY